MSDENNNISKFTLQRQELETLVETTESLGIRLCAAHTTLINECIEALKLVEVAEKEFYNAK